jgi:hypothetical protein
VADNRDKNKPNAILGGYVPRNNRNIRFTTEWVKENSGNMRTNFYDVNKKEIMRMVKQEPMKHKL